MKCHCWLLHLILVGSNMALLHLMMQQFSSVDMVQTHNIIHSVLPPIEDFGHPSNGAVRKNSTSSCDHSVSVVPKNRTSNWCIMVSVGADLFQERQRQRENCREKFYDVADRIVADKKLSLHFVFVVGIPSYDTRPVDDHVHGQLATAREINVASALLEEQRIHGDLYITPHRDHYRDLTEKKLGLLKRGVELGCNYIFKVDHEYCLNVEIATKLIDQHERQHPDQELYLGNRLWTGLEHPDLMTGPNNETTPYFSGHLHGLSKGLASVIVYQDWTHSVLKAAYGTSSEDQNTGLWVQYASQVHGIKVNWVTSPRIRLDCRRSNRRPKNNGMNMTKHGVQSRGANAIVYRTNK